MTASWKESGDKPRPCVEKQRRYSADKGPCSQGYGLPSGHIYGCESWRVMKAECQRLMPSNCGAETSESPWDSKEIKPVNLKGDQPWIFPGRTDAEAEAPALLFWSFDENRQLAGKVPGAGKDRGQKEKRASEGEMAGWHHWCNEHELGQTPDTVKDREAWRAAVHGVTESDTTVTEQESLETGNITFFGKRGY